MYTVESIGSEADCVLVTLLSILGTHAIALPLSAAFPAAELQYILDQSRASMLLSSAKFGEKAEQVIAKGLAAAPKHVKLEKRFGAELKGEVILDGCEEGKGGMMLYTSGTTNRPVSFPRVYLNQYQHLIERSFTPSKSNDGAIPVPSNSMELHAR